MSSPIKAYWDVSPTYPYKCLNDGAIVFAASVINIFTDFLVTALPMPLIWSLKLPARQRLAVISIFGLGIIVNVAGSVRTVYVWKSMVVGYDTTWLGWPVLIAAAVEINLGLVSLQAKQTRDSPGPKKMNTLTRSHQICSSAPALRPLIATFLPRLLNSTRNINYSYNQRSRSQKLFSSAGRSRGDHIPTTHNSRKGDYESDRFEIMRTVEMETFTESRLAHHDSLGHTYDIGTENRAVSPESIEMKHVFSSAASEKSSSSLTRDDPYFPRR